MLNSFFILELENRWNSKGLPLYTAMIYGNWKLIVTGAQY